MSLSTQYLGLTLKNPLVASASPANAQLDHLKHLEDAGAAAVVLPSLFQEQLEAEDASVSLILSNLMHNSPEALSYFPEDCAGPYGVGPDAYLDLIRRAREALSIPVIASLNGSSEAGWIAYARSMQQAGASAIELNIYFIPIDVELTGQEVEDRYTRVVGATRRAVSVPLAVKLSPYVSALPNLVQRLHAEGADGMVLFNRLLQPDFDLTAMKLIETIPLSTSNEISLPLSWISLLAGRTGASLAASTGVETDDDVVKYLLAGADVVMTTSALLRHGPRHLKQLLNGLKVWMEVRNFTSVSNMRGLMSWSRSRHKELYGRANYIKMLETGVAD